MTTDNWINLIAAILVGGGTLFLGIMAWRTIRQTRTIQKAEKRERLLNEIIDWATDVAKCESLSQVPVLPILNFKTAGRELANAVIEHTNRVTMANLGLRYQTIDARSESIKIVAKKLDKSLGTNLHSAVSRTANKLDKNLEIIDKLIKGEATEQEYKEHWLSLVKSAKALAKKTVNLID